MYQFTDRAGLGLLATEFAGRRVRFMSERGGGGGTAAIVRSAKRLKGTESD